MLYDLVRFYGRLHEGDESPKPDAWQRRKFLRAGNRVLGPGSRGWGRRGDPTFAHRDYGETNKSQPYKIGSPAFRQAHGLQQAGSYIPCPQLAYMAAVVSLGTAVKPL